MVISEQFLSIFPEALVITDLQFHIITLNKRVHDLFPNAAHNIIGAKIDALHADLALDKDKIVAELELMQHSTINNISFKHAGITRYFLVEVHDIKLQDRNFWFVFKDITKEKHIENIMIQTSKMMSLGAIIAGIAHELNNPLGAIMQGAQNILRRTDPRLESNLILAKKCNVDLEAVNKYLTERGLNDFVAGIRNNGERISHSIKKMLQFSKRAKRNATFVKLEDLIDQSIELASTDYDLKKVYEFKKIKVVKIFSNIISTQLCIVNEIEQVIYNMIKNAAQAIFDKKQNLSLGEDYIGEIAITVLQTDKHTEISIADNGIGMDAETLNKAFEPFYTTREVHIGTGLGLATAFYIIHTNHQGLITVESKKNYGSKFTIKLPLNLSSLT